MLCALNSCPSHTVDTAPTLLVLVGLRLVSSDAASAVAALGRCGLGRLACPPGGVHFPASHSKPLSLLRLTIEGGGLFTRAALPPRIRPVRSESSLLLGGDLVRRMPGSKCALAQFHQNKLESGIRLFTFLKETTTSLLVLHGVSERLSSRRKRWAGLPSFVSVCPVQRGEEICEMSVAIPSGSDPAGNGRHMSLYYLMSVCVESGFINSIVCGLGLVCSAF